MAIDFQQLLIASRMILGGGSFSFARWQKWTVPRISGHCGVGKVKDRASKSGSRKEKPTAFS